MASTTPPPKAEFWEQLPPRESWAECTFTRGEGGEETLSPQIQLMGHLEVTCSPSPPLTSMENAGDGDSSSPGSKNMLFPLCVPYPFGCVLLLFSCSVVSNSLRPHGLQYAWLPCLPEFAQTHVHWVGDAIQPSHPLPPSSPFALNLSQHQGLFWWTGPRHRQSHRNCTKKYQKENPRFLHGQPKMGNPQETGKYQGDCIEKEDLGNKLMMLSSNFWAHRQARRAWILSQTELQRQKTELTGSLPSRSQPDHEIVGIQEKCE